MPFASLLLLLFPAGFSIFVVVQQMAIGQGFTKFVDLHFCQERSTNSLVLLLKKHTTCIVLSVKINFVFHCYCIYLFEKLASVTLISNATDAGKVPTNSTLISNYSSNDPKQFLLFYLWLC